MGLTELFNEWIVERGSAKVQEKHIALFRDRLAVADKKISELESENEVLKSQVAKFKSESDNLRIANNELAEKLKENENRSQSNLPEIEINILIFLFKQSPKAQISAEQITYSIKTDLQSTEFYLGELKQKKLITEHNVPDNWVMGTRGCRYWTLTHEGRRYLIEHKRI